MEYVVADPGLTVWIAVLIIQGGVRTVVCSTHRGGIPRVQRTALECEASYMLHGIDYTYDSWSAAGARDMSEDYTVPGTLGVRETFRPHN